MTRRDPLYQWTDIVASHFPALSRPQACVLALWSYGIVLAQSCTLTAVAGVLASVLAIPINTSRQRLREWYQDAATKAGHQRREIAIETCFRPLLGWVLSLWQGTHLALALDATTLSDRLTVLVVSVLYRGCAVPVGWVVLPGNEPGRWRPHWLSLLRHLWHAVPCSWTVVVLADRGLYAPWLYRRICRLGWHPLLRINAGGTFRPAREATFRPLISFVPRPGSLWHGTGTAFKKPENHLRCTLLACWAEQACEPWLVLTDLAPTEATIAWYRLRMWIEHGFKLWKSDGWHWPRCRMVDPERAARLWLTMALATLWIVSIGGAADTADTPESVPDLCVTPGTPPTPRRQRRISVFRRGWQLIIAALLNRRCPTPAPFYPERWPALRIC